MIFPKVKLKISRTRVFKNKRGWRIIGDRKIYLRSEWEARVAKYLQTLKEISQIKDWEHEPETFWFNEIKRGVRSYLPDFKVTMEDGSHYWIEVKGYMDKRSQTKLKRFRKYYPGEQLFIFDEDWFSKNGNKLLEGKCGLNGTTNSLTLTK